MEITGGLKNRSSREKGWATWNLWWNDGLGVLSKDENIKGDSNTGSKDPDVAEFRVKVCFSQTVQTDRDSKKTEAQEDTINEADAMNARAWVKACERLESKIIGIILCEASQ